jgi:hypothetical protein
MARKIWFSLAIAFGIAVITLTIWYIIIGVAHPSADKSIAIALLSAIGVPISFAIIAVGYRGLRGPDAAILRTEAEARKRTAAALDDAETAEKIKAELNAYVVVRTWWLEIERKRSELSQAASSVIEMLKELNESERQLGIEKTKLSVETVETLDSLLESSPAIQIPDLYFDMLGGMLGGKLGGRIAEISVNESFKYWQRRKMRRMAELAPEALSENKDR